MKGFIVLKISTYKGQGCHILPCDISHYGENTITVWVPSEETWYSVPATEFFYEYPLAVEYAESCVQEG